MRMFLFTGNYNNGFDNSDDNVDMNDDDDINNKNMGIVECHSPFELKGIYFKR